jgi:hypothetical protein
MAVRYMRKGVSGVILVPTIASATLAPTVAEVNAGTVLNTQLTELNGFEFSNSPINAPDFDSTFVSQVSGEDAAAASSLVFHELNTYVSNLIKIALPKGTVANIVLSPYKKAPLAAADKVETWPIVVTAAPRIWTSGNETAKYRVGVALTAPPAIDIAVLASQWASTPAERRRRSRRRTARRS